MNWRFIPYDRYDPYVKTGLNVTAMNTVRNGGDPILWISGWEKDCINVGYNQTVHEVIDVEQVNELDIPIVRRQGDGGAVYLTREGEITWGLATPIEYFGSRDTEAAETDRENTFRSRFDSFVDNFLGGRRGTVNKLVVDDTAAHEMSEEIIPEVCLWVVNALERLGIEAYYKDESNDVMVRNKKISGVTGVECDGTVYVGGTLLYGTDKDQMDSLLTPSAEKLEKHGIESPSERICCVSELADVTYEKAREAMRDALLADKEYEVDGWTEIELKNAKSHAEEKYQTKEYIFKNDPMRTLL